MADDGMLLNFSIGDELPSAQPKLRGGRWKDRLIAKKQLQRFRNPKSQVAKTNSDPAENKATSTGIAKDSPAVDQPPPKRQKLSTAPHQPRPNSTKPSQEVISSLFSSNPSAHTPAPKSTKKDDRPVEPSNAPLQDDGVSTFTSLGLSPILSNHLIAKLLLKTPTAIQASTISQLLKEDSDAFVQAETGSGKTLAYLLPIVQRIMALSSQNNNDEGKIGESIRSEKSIHRDSGLFAIILAPTRELCKQISVVLEGLLRCANWIVAGTVIGGEKKKSEKARLRRGVNILVATPGRLVDHLANTEVLDVGLVRWLVLDEGDRLMDLGFEDDIKEIVRKLEAGRSDEEQRTVATRLPNRRTTIMCSATMKMNVQRLGEISLRDAVHITAEPHKADEAVESTSSEDKAFLAPAQLKQSFIIVPPKQRLVTLAALLKHTFARRGSVMKSIVFLSCADSVDFHYEIFSRKSTSKDTPKSNDSDKENIANSPTKLTSEIPTVTHASILASVANPSLKLHKLHGSLSQSIRTATLSSFVKTAEPSILLCTDVASRGLDLPNIELIIEYDPPFSSDDHLHRIGRTARAGREGRAVIFLMPGSEEGYVDVLKKSYRDGAGNGPVRHEAEEMLSKGFGNAEFASAVDQSVGGSTWIERAEEWQLSVERWVIDDKRRAGEVAKRAFVSHVRAYATHVAKERSFFDVKNLHLGHLAKAFALRDRPGNMGRAGSEIEKGPKRGRIVKGQTEGVDQQDTEISNTMMANEVFTTRQDPASKMRKKIREHMTSASEFNIG
ncbi:MAG: hypothetical protein Q9190_000890 [Brigantiaea leucoxantha]